MKSFPGGNTECSVELQIRHLVRNGNASCKKSECKSHGTGTMRLAASAERRRRQVELRDPQDLSSEELPQWKAEPV